MDTFTQKRYLTITIAVLVILNLGTLTLLMIGRPQNFRPPGQGQDPQYNKERIHHLLQQELGFDKSQVDTYLHMRETHQHRVRQIDQRLREVKRQMFDAALRDEQPAILSDSLLTLTQALNAQLDRLTFEHLVDLRKLCRSDQQDELQVLIHELFRNQHPPGTPPPQDKP